MAVEKVKRTEQARGEFNGGEILENKPIGFPREGGKLKPYSSLFYWAHAWSEEGSTIGLHPHQGFEILSFVVEGSIDHYDTSDNIWKPIEKGGAQIIRSGNGISHSERLNAGAHMFQIWFDPNLSTSLEKPASYNDYLDKDFPIEDTNGVKTKTYKGEGAPMEMGSPGVEIKEISFTKGSHSLDLDASKIYSMYLINGEVKTNEGEINDHDFLRVSGESNIDLDVTEESRFFVVVSPINLNYATYYDAVMAKA